MFLEELPRRVRIALVLLYMKTVLEKLNLIKYSSVLN